MNTAMQPARIGIPPALSQWAGEIAEINVDLHGEGLVVKGGYRTPCGRGTFSLYGGHAPVAVHVDDPDEMHPVWGLILHAPEGRLRRHDGVTPAGIGTLYSLDPSRPHGFESARGLIAFAATWGYDPVSAFGTIDAFGASVLEGLLRMRASEPDPISFLERELDMPGELR